MRGLVVGLVGLLLVAGCSSTQTMPAAEAPPVNGTPAAVSVADPVRVTIPRLAVIDEIVPVGLEQNGEMELPDVSEVGWYRFAPKPGEPGRAVLAGHVDWDGVDGAFKHLGDLRAGDELTITDASGASRVFAVYDVQQIPKADYQARTVPLVFGATGEREIALVTCSGRVVQHDYLDNTVVSARLAS